MAQVRVGIVGTSWWAEAMYLPALSSHPHGRITAMCGRDIEKARKVAAEWGIEHVYATVEEMLENVDAVIVASSNASHHSIALTALRAGAHVLCEKPLGLNGTEADELAAAADAAGVVTLTPFTYRFMPVVRELQHRISTGYVGNPYHMAARYYTGYAREGEYSWRFDRAEAGSGVLGDLGSHWIDLALYLLGPITQIGAVTNTTVRRAPRPDGSEGTLHAYNDWDTVQEVRGLRSGERGPAPVLERTPHIWEGLRTGTVHDTYRDVFRTTEAMTRGWVTAIATGSPCAPDLAHGALVQRITDAAVASAASDGRLIDIA